VDATCRRGERTLIFLFEESQSQLLRNMRSIGVDLEPWIRKGLLRIHAARPTLYGLESHLVAMHKLTDEFKPSVVVMDPVTNLSSGGTVNEAKSLLTRLIDYYKTNRSTTFFTSLTTGDRTEEASGIGISSLMDTWLLVRDLETNGERNRVLYVLKSRGMAHSNQVREFKLTDSGIDLVDVYVGPGGVLTGTARLAQQAREASEGIALQSEFAGRKRQLDRNCLALNSQIKALQLDLETVQEELKKIGAQNTFRKAAEAHVRAVMAKARYADPLDNGVHLANSNHRKEA
jgi:circadian clock protein KaiC